MLSAKLECGDCGGWYGPKVWHSNSKYRTVIWQCNHKFSDEKCRTPHIAEEEVKNQFITAYNTLLKDRSKYIEVCVTIREVLCDTAAIDAESEELVRDGKANETISLFISKLSETTGYKYLKSSRSLKKTVGQIVFEVLFFSSKWNDDNIIEINADFRVSYIKFGAASTIHGIVASKSFRPEQGYWFDISSEDKNEILEQLSESDKQQIDDYKNGNKNKAWMLNRSNMRFVVDNGYI